MATRVEDLLSKILAALEGSPSGLAGEFGAGRARTPGGAAGLSADNLADVAAAGDEAADLLAKFKEINDINEKMTQRARALGRQIARTNSQMDQSIMLYDQRLIKLDSEIEKNKIAFAEKQEEIAAEQELIEQQAVRGELSGEALEAAKDRLDELREELKVAKDLIEADIERAENTERAQEATRGIVSETESVLNMMGLSGRAYDSGFFGQIEDLGEGNFLKGMAKGFEGIATAIGSAIAPTNLLANALSQIYQTTISMIGAQDRALASFQKQTGAGLEYNNVIRETREASFAYGVTIDEAAGAVSALYQNFTDFTTLSKASQIQVSAFTAKLENFGIQAEETATLFNDMTKSVGMSVEQAQGAILQAISAAKGLGMPVAEYSRKLRESMPVLAAYGKKSISIFNQMQAVAKKTGIEVTKLTQTFATQFDTFQSSAEAASKLNSLLGGPFVNNMTLMKKIAEGPAEAMTYLRRQMEMSGKSFQDFGYYGKQALANVFKTDVDTLGKFLRGSSEDMQAYMAEVAAAEQHQADLAAQAEAARPAQEKLTAALQQLAIAVQPLVDILHFLLDNIIVPITDFLGGFTIPVFYGLITAFKVWRGATVAASAATVTQIALEGTLAGERVVLTAATTANAAATEAAALATTQQSFAARTLTSSLAPLVGIQRATAAGNTMMGATGMFAAKALGGLALASAAVYAVYAIIKNSPVMYILLPIVAGGILMLGKAAAVAAPLMAAAAVPMKAFGIGLSLIGVGVALVGAGIFLLGKGLAAILEGMTGLVEAMIAGADNLLPFALALPLVGVGGFLAMGGLIAMGIGLAALGVGLFFVKTEDLQALAMMFEGVGKAAEAGGMGLSNIIGPLEALADAADDLDDDDMEALGKMFTDLSKLNVGTGINSFTSLFEQISDLGEAASKVDALTSSILGLSTAMSLLSSSMEGTGIFGGTAVSLIFAKLAEFGNIAPTVTPALDSAANFISSTSTLTTTNVESTTGLLKAITDAASQLSAGDSATVLKEIVDKLSALMAGGANQSGQGNNAPQPVILSMDRAGREVIARGVIDPLMPLLNKKLDLRNS